MKRSPGLKTVVFTFKSVTFAIKARRALSRGGISSRIRKLDMKASEDGCTHAVEVNGEDYYSVVAILKNNGISFNVKNNL